MSFYTVMCKIPNGLLLDLGDDDPRKVRLNGSHHASAIAGAGVTQVPADFWDAWRAKYKDFPPMQNGAMWAADKEADAKAQAKELEQQKTGFEGIDPEKPMAGVEPTEEQKKENAKIERKG